MTQHKSNYFNRFQKQIASLKKRYLKDKKSKQDPLHESTKQLQSETSKLLLFLKKELTDFEKQSSSLLDQNKSLQTHIELEKNILQFIGDIQKILRTRLEKIKEANSKKEMELKKTIKTKAHMTKDIDHINKRIHKQEQNQLL